MIDIERAEVCRREVNHQIMHTRTAVRASEWASQHFYLSAQSASVAGAFRPLPYQVAPMDIIGAGVVREMTWRKPSRIGMTTMFVAAVGYLLEHRKYKTLIYQPTDNYAKLFAKRSIDPMFYDCEVMGDLLQGAGQHNRSNNIQSKEFNNGANLDVLGGNSPRNFRGMTKDIVFYDEVDAFERSAGMEGDPVFLGDRRVSESVFALSVRGSTPTTDFESVLMRCEEAADLNFRFWLPCPRCGEYAPLLWGGVGVGHGIEWKTGQPETAEYRCQVCYDTWQYAELRPALALGEWRTNDGVRIDRTDSLRLVGGDGAEIDWPRHVGFSMWGGYSPFIAWSQMAREWLDVQEDLEQRRAFTNTVLGEYWSDTLASVESNDLMGRRHEYGVPNDIKLITFGVDVQGDRLEAELVGWGTGEESWSLGYRVFDGDPTEWEIWDELRKWCRQEFLTDDGRPMRARCGVVDSGYLTDEVMKFCRRSGQSTFIAGKGSSVYNQPVIKMPRKKDPTMKVRLAMIGTDTCKDVLFSYFARQDKRGHGVCHWRNTAMYDDEYFRRLASEKRVSVRVGRVRRIRWEKFYEANEALDCRVYAFAAARLAQHKGWVDLGTRVGDK